jgi:acyl carrier protein
MEMEKLIDQLYEEFDELQPGALTPETSFRELDEWSSMHALIIIAMVDIEYGVTLTGEDLTNAQTVQDLYNIIQQKKGS